MSSLTTVHELDTALRSDAPPLVLDVRWNLLGPPGKDEYLRAHVPGAVFVDLERDLAAEPGSAGRHPLPAPAHLESALRVAGVTDDKPVVVYDAGNGSVAARAWWLLRWAGHHQVSVLDGGYAAWEAAAFDVSAEQPVVPEGDFVVRPGQMPVADADRAAELARGARLLDARAPERYTGEVEPIDPRAGHIPGAINAPFTEHTGSSGQWRPPDELARRFQKLGVTADTPVGAYCGSGVTACSVVLALEHAGMTSPDNPAILYAGSWSHWVTDSDRPIATGDQPG